MNTQSIRCSRKTENDLEGGTTVLVGSLVDSERKTCKETQSSWKTDAAKALKVLPIDTEEDVDMQVRNDETVEEDRKRTERTPRGGKIAGVESTVDAITLVTESLLDILSPIGTEKDINMQFADDETVEEDRERTIRGDDSGHQYLSRLAAQSFIERN
ncbi:hypothetical protein B0H11DRAFT_1905385 [Mycena galericulata]|nr:hypothetical protein B0H11DRAFT_1905385 [Mycena galericulata]